MKKTIFVIFGLSVFLMGCATPAFTPVTEADRTITYEIQYSISNEQTFRLTKLWIAESFNSAKDVITFEDSELGVITGRFSTQVFFAISPTTVWMNFKITLKDNVSTLEFTNITIGGGRIEYMNQKNKILETTDLLYNSYKQKLL